MIAQRKKQNFASFKTPRPDLIYVLYIYVLYMSYKTARVSNVLLVMVADCLWCILFCCIYIMIWNSCQGISTQFFLRSRLLKNVLPFLNCACASKEHCACAKYIFLFFYDRPIWSPKSYHL